jgi:hypothetical protein
MADDKTTTAVKPATPAKTAAPPYWFVRVSHPISNKRIVFRSVSENRARLWVENRCPRGELFYLEGPDGVTESFVYGRLNEDGTDADEWGPFDPSQFIPLEEQTPPGAAGWPDLEG